MAWRFVLESEAETDFWKTFEFYANIDPDLGERYIQDFDHAIDEICQFPESSQAIDDISRRKLLDKFPHYIVFNLIEPDLILCLAVGHTRRRPFYWIEK
jgi:plasmid stabilization system protein ParE